MKTNKRWWEIQVAGTQPSRCFGDRAKAEQLARQTLMFTRRTTARVVALAGGYPLATGGFDVAA